MGAPPSATGLTVGMDVGGTKLLGGLIDAQGQVHHRVRRQTPPQGGAQVTAAIVSLARDLFSELGGPAPVGLGVAAAVTLDGAVRYAPNIPGWDGTPLQQLLRQELGVAVRVDNDANTAAWAEHVAGAGRGQGQPLLMITVGTGLGGGLVANGQVWRGHHGLGAEVGHLVLDQGGPVCGCGNQGCLEALASGTAIGRTAARLLAERTDPSTLRDAGAPSGKHVTLAAQAGDALAVEVLAHCGAWLGVGIASLINALDPAVVVVGGGAMEAGELLLAPARAAAAPLLMGAPHRRLPPVVPAALGDDAGMAGAALLAAAHP